MKSKTLAALTMILGIALSTTTFAQGRHDEKPHGSTKPTATQEGKAPPAATGGRHDAGGTTHGTVKAKAKKDNAKAVDDKGGK